MERLRSENILPIRVTFNSLIKASRTRPERGEHWYHEMLKAGLEPNIQTYNKVGRGVGVAFARTSNGHLPLVIVIYQFPIGAPRRS